MNNRVTCEYIPLPPNGQASHLKVEVYYTVWGAITYSPISARSVATTYPCRL